MDELPDRSDLPPDPDVLALPDAADAPVVPREPEPRSHTDEDESDSVMPRPKTPPAP